MKAKKIHLKSSLCIYIYTLLLALFSLNAAAAPQWEIDAKSHAIYIKTKASSQTGKLLILKKAPDDKFVKIMFPLSVTYTPGKELYENIYRVSKTSDDIELLVKYDFQGYTRGGPIIGFASVVSLERTPSNQLLLTASITSSEDAQGFLNAVSGKIGRINLEVYIRNQSTILPLKKLSTKSADSTDHFYLAGTLENHWFQFESGGFWDRGELINFIDRNLYIKPKSAMHDYQSTHQSLIDQASHNKLYDLYHCWYVAEDQYLGSNKNKALNVATDLALRKGRIPSMAVINWDVSLEAIQAFKDDDLKGLVTLMRFPLLSGESSSRFAKYTKVSDVFSKEALEKIKDLRPTCSPNHSANKPLISFTYEEMSYMNYMNGRPPPEKWRYGSANLGPVYVSATKSTSSNHSSYPR